MPITVDQALTAYVRIRDDVAAQEKEFKKFKAEQKENLVTLEGFFAAKMKEVGTDTLKANGLTVFTATKDSVSIEDKETFKLALAKMVVASLNELKFIEHCDDAEVATAIASSSAFDLLTLSANKINCKAFMADNKGLMPSGIKYVKENVVQIRKGAKK